MARDWKMMAATVGGLVVLPFLACAWLLTLAGPVPDTPFTEPFDEAPED